MTTLHAIASEVHYFAHIKPVLDRWGGNDVVLHRNGRSIGWGNEPVLAASWRDARTATRKGHAVILMEHGAGQSYVGLDNPAYVGATDRSGVILYLAPNKACAERHRAAHPEIPVEVVGCPRLDDLLAIPRPAEPAVAITHHWRTGITPETVPAFPHFCSAYPALAERFTVYGHGHPRDAARSSLWFKRHRIGWLPSFRDVAEHATVLVVDNSSAGAEWMAMDRPVIWLNAPWYRRDMHHGGRFWDWARAGIQVDHPDDLATAVAASIATDPLAHERRKLIPELYANPGTAAQAAADAIRSFLDT